MTAKNASLEVRAREFFGCDADGHSDACASLVDYAEDESGCSLLSAEFLKVSSEARAEEGAKALVALDDITKKATPYGPGIMEGGENYADMYLVPAGPIHRALGILRGSADRTTHAVCNTAPCSCAPSALRTGSPS